MQTSTGFKGRLSLRQLLPEAEFFGTDDLWISGCSRDSRRVRANELFAALPGVDHDGHDYLSQAVERGCAAVLVQKPVAIAGVPVCVVPDTRDAYGRICQALAGNPSRKLKVVGITGTNGKTTTSCLVANILSAAGHRVGLMGTLWNYDGKRRAAAGMTTPPSEQLARWLGRMAANGCSHAVLEVSSHALDQSRVAGISFDVACVTNVRRDHLDYHRTLLGYRLAKSRLLEHLSADGFAVVNADDVTASGYLRQFDGPALTVAMHSAAEITGTLVERHPSEQTFLLSAGNETIPVRTEMIGTHHVYNCLMAAAVGLAYGIDLPTVVRGLEAVGHLPGRLERIECGQAFGVFVDYAHTPDALEGTLAALRDVTPGRLICVFGAGGERDRQKRPLMGQAVERGADRAIVTSDNPRREDPRQIVQEILDGFDDASRAEVVLDRAEAIAAALADAREGDCVLIAGKGHEDYQIVGRKRTWFDDREVARRVLYNQPHDGMRAAG